MASERSSFAGGGKGSGARLETRALEKVAEAAAAIAAAASVGEALRALHAVAARLFPVDSAALAGVVDEPFRSQIINAASPSDDEMNSWRRAFYYGPAFPTMSKILLGNVALKWLRQFPTAGRKQIYDSFFVEGPLTEVIQALVPVLNQKGDSKDDLHIICLNVERLLIICLLENEGISRMVGEFTDFNKHDDHIVNPDGTTFISRVAQLLASIPDKTRPGASSALSSSYFFKRVVSQLLAGAEKRAAELAADKDANVKDALDSAFLFVGEVFSRVCRRGSTGVLVAELIPRIHNHLQRCLVSESKVIIPDMIGHFPQSQFWFNMIEAIRDQHSIERLTEEMLHQLASQDMCDEEAYLIFWSLFTRSFKHITAMRQTYFGTSPGLGEEGFPQNVRYETCLTIEYRAMFIDKFLLWKTFPLCCLRWILHYSVFECPPNSTGETEMQKTPNFFNTLQRLVSIWSTNQFIQSSSMEQQAYITAAVGLCLERLSKTELETTTGVLNSILQGVSCRLESPIDLVRKMASAIALTFSKIVDPKNPLFLDDNCSETVDWEFGVLSPKKKITDPSQRIKGRTKPKSSLPENERSVVEKNGKAVKHNTPDSKAKIVEIKLIEPAEISDPSTNEHLTDEDSGEESKNFDASSDSSLEPYDLSDDDTDLHKKFSQLSDLAAALRKPDDPDGVESALSYAEKLVRASPDELRHISGDLVRALVHVRCSDVAMEGEEDSAEEKRQKALVALLVTCPFESLDVLTKLLYSSSVDVSQRILIIDVMTEAAQELAETKVVRRERRHSNLISDTSLSWMVPSDRGPRGAGPWREVSEPGMHLSWSQRYEREVPSRSGQVKSGKSRKWGIGKTRDTQVEWSKNRFPLYAAAFMLPAMQGFDKRKHGVDFLNRDFIVLGKLIYMLGVCMKCTAMHPEASALAPALLDMIRSRAVSQHAEAYVRRSVLFAASCILVALHPSFVASALIEGNQDISTGLEWIRTWALHVAEADPDTDCTSIQQLRKCCHHLPWQQLLEPLDLMQICLACLSRTLTRHLEMAMTCLRFHSELALQTSRALESADHVMASSRTLPPKLDNIIIPFSNMK